jgi:hypothetical protein
MKKQNAPKLFAFKLAEKKAEEVKAPQWKARDGVATAGCSGFYTRADKWVNGNTWVSDQGYYC